MKPSLVAYDRHLLSTVELTYQPTYRLYDIVRRGLDLVLSVVGMIVLAPIFLAVGLAIKLDDPGPVFYRQRRIGRDRRRARQALLHDGNLVQLDLRREDLGGRPFEMIKFRTMYTDAESRTGAVWASNDDPRCTRVGRFLRKTRLDELPQLWNVLCGHMTLVGPRPERPEFVRELVKQIDHYGDRHLITPGITGLAQIRQGYDTCLDDVRRKVQHDLEYIRRRSFVLDVSICVQTLLMVVRGRNGSNA